MPPVTVYYHEAAVAGSEDAFRVPGMESEMILPPPNNLSAKGRPMGERRRTPATAGGPPSSPRPGYGRYGVRNFGDPTPPTPQPGVLTGNGSVFIGTKGIMATVDRGEGVHLLPAAALGGIHASTAVAYALTRPHAGLGANLQGRRPGMLRLQRQRALRGVAGARRDLHCMCPASWSGTPGICASPTVRRPIGSSSRFSGRARS